MTTTADLPTWTDDYEPQHFTLECFGCDGFHNANEWENEAWIRDADPDEPAENPINVTLSFGFCEECDRVINLEGWLLEHLARFLYDTDDLIATAQMIKERFPALTPQVNDGLQLVVSELQRLLDRMQTQ